MNASSFITFFTDKQCFSYDVTYLCDAFVVGISSTPVFVSLARQV